MKGRDERNEPGGRARVQGGGGEGAKTNFSFVITKIVVIIVS